MLMEKKSSAGSSFSTCYNSLVAILAKVQVSSEPAGEGVGEYSERYGKSIWNVDIRSILAFPSHDVQSYKQ